MIKRKCPQTKIKQINKQNRLTCSRIFTISIFTLGQSHSSIPILGASGINVLSWEPERKRQDYKDVWATGLLGLILGKLWGQWCWGPETTFKEWPNVSNPPDTSAGILTIFPLRNRLIVMGIAWVSGESKAKYQSLGVGLKILQEQEICLENRNWGNSSGATSMVDCWLIEWF